MRLDVVSPFTALPVSSHAVDESRADENRRVTSGNKTDGKNNRESLDGSARKDPE